MVIISCGERYQLKLPFNNSSDEAEELREHIVEDPDAVDLSYVGNAAYETLRKKHSWHKDALWNVTTGKIIGELHQTPNLEES